MKVHLGVAPIAWSNDDLPELGGNTSLETCLAESKLAGFSGVETGGKFPPTSAELMPILDHHGLVLASGWFSGTLLTNDVDNEIERITPQLTLFRECGAPVIFYGETSGTVQNVRDAPLSSRPKMPDEEFPGYGRRMTALAEHCAENGVALSFHHHMGTAVENEREVDLLMNHTGEALGLLFDTGHMLFAGGDPIRMAKNHGHRINHVHAKDVRGDILARIDKDNWSFLDSVLEGVFTVPGDGMIDFDAVARTLAEMGYEGWVIVEAEQDPAKADPFEYSRIGFNTMTAALTAAGFQITD
ncbi:MAG: myo-inosose-2 dehydratase [Hyphomicrobiales bacterium]|jgi:inosose dehydratase|nr:myo-inosose-2 dehydratase [Hyphomicrobiales bacterium]